MPILSVCITADTRDKELDPIARLNPFHSNPRISQSYHGTASVAKTLVEAVHVGMQHVQPRLYIYKLHKNSS